MCSRDYVLRMDHRIMTWSSGFQDHPQNVMISGQSSSALPQHEMTTPKWPVLEHLMPFRTGSCPPKVLKGVIWDFWRVPKAEWMPPRISISSKSCLFENHTIMMQIDDFWGGSVFGGDLMSEMSWCHHILSMYILHNTHSDILVPIHSTIYIHYV